MYTRYIVQYELYTVQEYNMWDRRIDLFRMSPAPIYPIWAKWWVWNEKTIVYFRFVVLLFV